MRTGQLARRAGVKDTTLRFYERAGMLAPPQRGANGYRDYGEEDLARVRFIRRAQELGFTLTELRAFLALSSRGGALPARAEAFAQTKLAEIDARVRDLRRMKRAILGLLACGGAKPGAACPVVASLAEGPRAAAPPARRAASPRR
jgi:DNA-binding transcriptional MerR regulator